MGMRVIWAVSIIASILILGTLVTGITPSAYAVPTLTITDATLNEARGQLTITSDVSGFTISNGGWQVVVLMLDNVNTINGFGLVTFNLDDQNNFLSKVSGGFGGLVTIDDVSLDFTRSTLKIKSFIFGYEQSQPEDLLAIVFLINNVNEEIVSGSTNQVKVVGAQPTTPNEVIPACDQILELISNGNIPDDVAAMIIENLGCVVEDPSITPTSGPAGTSFTIFDPQGRMTCADRIIFSSAVTGSEAPAFAVSFSADGKTATGVVPFGCSAGLHDVTVHCGDPFGNPPLFDALQFSIG